MKNITIRVKLLTGFIAIALIAGFIGITGNREVNNVNNEIDTMYETGLVPISELTHIIYDYQDIRINYRDMINESDLTKINKEINDVEVAIKSINEMLEKYEKGLRTEAGRKLYNNFVSNYQLSIEDVRSLYPLCRVNNDKDALVIRNGVLRESILKTVAAFDEILDAKIEYSHEIENEAEKTVNRSLYILSLMTIIGIVLAVLLGLLISRNIQQILKQLTDELAKLVNDTKNGKLETRADSNKINFEFREIPEGINNTLDALIKPLNVTAEYVSRISIGDHLQLLQMSTKATSIPLKTI